MGGFWVVAPYHDELRSLFSGSFLALSGPGSHGEYGRSAATDRTTADARCAGGHHRCARLARFERSGRRRRERSAPAARRAGRAPAVARCARDVATAGGADHRADRHPPGPAAAGAPARSIQARRQQRHRRGRRAGLPPRGGREPALYRRRLRGDPRRDDRQGRVPAAPPRRRPRHAQRRPRPRLARRPAPPRAHDRGRQDVPPQGRPSERRADRRAARRVHPGEPRRGPGPRRDGAQVHVRWPRARAPRSAQRRRDGRARRARAADRRAAEGERGADRAHQAALPTGQGVARERDARAGGRPARDAGADDRADDRDQRRRAARQGRCLRVARRDRAGRAPAPRQLPLAVAGRGRDRGPRSRRAPVQAAHGSSRDRRWRDLVPGVPRLPRRSPHGQRRAAAHAPARAADAAVLPADARAAAADDHAHDRLGPRGARRGRSPPRGRGRRRQQRRRLRDHRARQHADDPHHAPQRHPVHASPAGQVQRAHRVPGRAGQAVRPVPAHVRRRPERDAGGGLPGEADRGQPRGHARGAADAGGAPAARRVPLRTVQGQARRRAELLRLRQRQHRHGPAVRLPGALRPARDGRAPPPRPRGAGARARAPRAGRGLRRSAQDPARPRRRQPHPGRAHPRLRDRSGGRRRHRRQGRARDGLQGHRRQGRGPVAAGAARDGRWRAGPLAGDPRQGRRDGRRARQVVPQGGQGHGDLALVPERRHRRGLRGSAHAHGPAAGVADRDAGERVSPDRRHVAAVEAAGQVQRQRRGRGRLRRAGHAGRRHRLAHAARGRRVQAAAEHGRERRRRGRRAQAGRGRAPRRVVPLARPGSVHRPHDARADGR